MCISDRDKLVLDLGASFIIQHDENMVTQGKYYNPLPALYLFPRSDDFDEIRLFERWDPVRGYMVQYWPYGEGAHSPVSYTHLDVYKRQPPSITCRAT